MIISPKPLKSTSDFKKYHPNPSTVWKKSFQMTFILGVIAFIFWAPVLYSTYSNFNYFLTLTHETQPQLSENFQRELATNVIFISLSALFSLGFIFFFSFRFFKQQELGLKKISHHLNQLRNENFNIDYISTAEFTDEVKEVAQSLDALQLKLIESTQADIELLNNVLLHSENHLFTSSLDKIVQYKRKQIGQPHYFGNVINLSQIQKRRKSA